MNCNVEQMASKKLSSEQKSNSNKNFDGRFHPQCLSLQDLQNLKWRNFSWTDGSNGKAFLKSVTRLHYTNVHENGYIRPEESYKKNESTRDNLSNGYFPTPSENVSVYTKDISKGISFKKSRTLSVDPSEIKPAGKTIYLLNYQPSPVSMLTESIKNRKSAPKSSGAMKFHEAKYQSVYETDFKDFFKEKRAKHLARMNQN